METRLSAWFRVPLATILLSAFLPLEVQVASAQARFNAPQRISAPGNRESGALRSDTCASTTAHSGLTAIVPETNVGLTTQAGPTLFAYVPPNNAEWAELRLFEEASGEEVLAAKVALPTATDSTADYQHVASVVSIPLPASGESALATGKSYLWALMVVCNGDNRAEDIVVTSVVQRVGDDYLQTLSPEVAQKLNAVASASDEEKLSTYGSAGIWQDLLSEVASLAEADPSTYEATWVSLLTDQGLSGIATAPIYESSLSPLTP